MRPANEGEERAPAAAGAPAKPKMTRYYKKEGPMWDRAFPLFVECEDGYLAAATDLAS